MESGEICLRLDWFSCYEGWKTDSVTCQMWKVHFCQNMCTYDSIGLVYSISKWSLCFATFADNIGQTVANWDCYCQTAYLPPPTGPRDSINLRSVERVGLSVHNTLIHGPTPRQRRRVFTRLSPLLFVLFCGNGGLVTERACWTSSPPGTNTFRPSLDIPLVYILRDQAGIFSLYQSLLVCWLLNIIKSSVSGENEVLGFFYWYSTLIIGV